MQRFSLNAKLFISLVVLLLLVSCGLEVTDPGSNPTSPTIPNIEETSQFEDNHVHEAGNGTGLGIVPSASTTLESLGDISIRVGAGLGQLANPTAPLAMKLLIIAATEDENGLQAAEALMKQVGVPYDVFIATKQTLTLETLMNGTSGRYQGIILTTSGLSDGTQSALDFEEWKTLWAYQSDLNVRQLTLYAFPSKFPEDYGLAGQTTDTGGFAIGSGTATTMTMTPEGQAVFPSLKGDAVIPVKNAFMYPSVIDTSSPAQVKPILQDKNGSILGALSTSADGRERMVLTMGHNPFLLHTQLLGYDMLRWLTQGVFIGERRMYLSIDIDDWYLESDVWNPATLSNFPYEEKTFRIAAKDAYAARDGVLDIRERFNAPTFNYIQVFNALKGNPNAQVNCSENASLSDASLCLGTFFDWVSHTFSHADMTTLNYDEARLEFEQNITFAESQPIDFDKQFLVTGRHSGLGWKLITQGDGKSCEVDQVTSDEYCQFGLSASNPEMLRAAADLGIKYLAANRGWNTHTRTDGCDTCLIPHPLNSSIKLIPRWPTNIFYNTTTPTENASEFNYLYGPNGIIKDGNGNPFFSSNQSWQQVLAFESEIAMRHVLSFSPYPHFFHQNNLKEYAPGRNLIYDWSEAVLTEYSKYFNTPIISQDWEGMTTTMSRRTSFFEALQANAISGTWNRVDNTISISTSKNATVFVTGADLASGGKWTYGADKVSRKWLTSGQTISGVVAKPVANRAPTLSSIANQSGLEGTATSIEVSFNDADKDFLGFSATNLPPGLAIDPATGKISGTPAYGTSGNYNVTVQLSDGQKSVQRSFSWNITSPPPITVFEADFEASMDGFSSYKDDLFRNTNQANYARGSRDIAGDYLVVVLGGINNNTINGMSGGFERSFSLNQTGNVTVELKYRLEQRLEYEDDEYAQALLSIDGQLYGLSGRDSLDQIAGGGDTNWKTVSVNIGTLAAGNHTIQIGGFNNKKTYNNEISKISFDDVKLTSIATGSSVNPTVPAIPNLAGNWSGYYSCYRCGLEKITITQTGSDVVATKVTGDNYIPAGQITWKANVSDKSGEGQIAGWNFSNPRFVPGTLTIINDNQVRFTWNGYGTITFNRTP